VEVPKKQGEEIQQSYVLSYRDDPSRKMMSS
jgi:hypothetical protein